MTATWQRVTAGMRLLMRSAANVAVDVSRPHPHQGVLPKFGGCIPEDWITSGDLVALREGRIVQAPLRHAGVSYEVAATLCHAEPAVIWNTVEDFPLYPQWIAGLSTCQLYHRGAGEHRARFVHTIMGRRMEYFLRYRRRPGNRLTTFSLDYAYASDFDDFVGYWRVTDTDVPGRPCRVEYGLSLRLRGMTTQAQSQRLTMRLAAEAVGFACAQAAARQSDLGRTAVGGAVRGLKRVVPGAPAVSASSVASSTSRSTLSVD